MNFDEIRKIMSTQRPVGFLCPHCGNWYTLPTKPKNKSLSHNLIEDHWFSFKEREEYPSILCTSGKRTEFDPYFDKTSNFFQLKVEGGNVMLNSDGFYDIVQNCHNIKSIEGMQKIADMPLYKIDVSQKMLRISFAIPCRNSLRCNDCKYTYTDVCFGFNSALKNTHAYFNEHGFHFGKFICTGFEYSFEPHQLPAFQMWNKLIGPTLMSSNLIIGRMETVGSFNEELNFLIKYSHHPVNDEITRRLNKIIAESKKQDEMLTHFINEVNTEFTNVANSTFLKFIDMMRYEGNYAYIYASYMVLVARNTVAETAIPKLNAFNVEMDKIISELDSLRTDIIKELDSLRTDIINEQAQVFDEIVGSGETV